MPLSPQLAAMLAASPAWPGARTMTVSDLRAAVRHASTMFPPLQLPLASIADRTIPSPAGEIKVRLYTPVGEGPFPVIAYFHGGGWVVGDLDTQDMIARALAHGASSIVMSVDYRLAPEHPFPAASGDCWAATCWLAKNAAELGGDPSRIAVAGDSAGGDLAAGVALFAREAGSPKLAVQVLIYNSANYPSEETASAREFADGPLLSRDDVLYFWSLYLPDPARSQHNQIASPIRARDHRNLPPAFVATAEIDPTRDDGEAYAAKLAAAGVKVEARRYAGMVHGFVSWLGVLPEAQQAIDDACAFLKAQFSR